ncbi:MAG TPA: hypothetical protein VKU00_14820 [Chthonomonadaceae bacterium]|nr:hypothetical protein [Chthonomonadaceae bacterium]
MTVSIRLAAVNRDLKYKARAVLHLAPRFSEGDRMGDTLHDGTALPHVWNRSPNYSVTDIFDPRQQALFFDYLKKGASNHAWTSTPTRSLRAVLPIWSTIGPTRRCR